MDTQTASVSQLQKLIAQAVREGRGSDVFQVTDPRALDLELTTTGVDEYLQGLGDDPFRSLSADGLRVPLFANSPTTRYLFQAVTIPVARGQRIRILGRRQIATLAVVQPPPGGESTAGPRVIELPITTPGFRLQNGNISWHLMRLRPGTGKAPRRFTDADSFIFRRAETGSALVYEAATFPAGHVNPFGRPDFYTSLTAYTPPNAGRPYGEPLLPAWHGIRNPWTSPHSAHWQALEVNGPCTVIDYISVLQTPNGGGTNVNQPTNTNNLERLGPPEEQFLAAWPGQVSIFRVGSAIRYQVL